MIRELARGDTSHPDGGSLCLRGSHTWSYGSLAGIFRSRNDLQQDEQDRVSSEQGRGQTIERAFMDATTVVMARLF